MQKIKRYNVGKILIMALLVHIVGCGNAEKKQEDTVYVKIDTVARNVSLDKLQYPAVVKAAKKVNLSFKINGAIQKIYAHEGDYVKAGSLLAQLDARDYELQLQAVESEYLGMKSDAERVFALHMDSVATDAEYDKARFGLQQITAKYRNAKNILNDTKIYAPFNGYIKNRYYDPPTVVGAGMPIVSILSSDAPEIEIYIPVSTYNRMNEKTTYFAKFDFHDKYIKIEKTAVSPSVNANQLYAVRFALPDSMSMMPVVGMSAMVDVLFDDDSGGGIKIPSNAIFRKGNRNFVWIYDNGRVEAREIVVSALHVNGSATIEQGLDVGEKIVTAGINNLDNGQAVKPLQCNDVTNKCRAL